MKFNLYKYHTDPIALAGYDTRDMVPSILFTTLTSDNTPWDEIVEKFEQYRPILGKDLDVALRAAEIYKNKTTENLWPVGGEVEMALLRSPEHREDHIKHHIGSKLLQDPRYIDVLRQLDPVFVARYLGYFDRLNYHVRPEFKEKVLEIINKNTVAGLAYALRSRQRNIPLERKLMLMTRSEWYNLVASSPNLADYHGALRHQSAWEYYLKCLDIKERLNAESDAKADYGYVT
jgi:hypothetical protein